MHPFMMVIQEQQLCLRRQGGYYAYLLLHSHFSCCNLPFTSLNFLVQARKSLSQVLELSVRLGYFCRTLLLP